MPLFVEFPIFAAAWGKYRENSSVENGFVVIAGGGGAAKSGVHNCIVSPL